MFKKFFYANMIITCIICQPIFCLQNQPINYSHTSNITKNFTTILQRIAHQTQPITHKSIAIARLISEVRTYHILTTPKGS
jgi:hypothetical protein